MLGAEQPISLCYTRDLGGGILSAVTALHNKNQCWLVDQSIFLTLFT